MECTFFFSQFFEVIDVLSKILRCNFCFHVLIMSGKVDVHADEERNH